MKDIVDLDQYPLDRPNSETYKDLIRTCKAELAHNGLFNLAGFLKTEAIESTLAELKPVLAKDAYTHARKHNIYFKKSIDGLPADHPALTEFETINHTICADQVAQTLIIQLYEWPPFAAFLAEVMEKEALFTMKDRLARVNVMAYRDGEALNWHFDRSEFTTTLLLQAPDQGGAFEYAQDLRTEDDPNYSGVAELLAGQNADVVQMPLTAGTLNVFRGKNTAHRVTPVEGSNERIISVFSFYDRPGVEFSAEDQIGFYGRSA